MTQIVKKLKPKECVIFPPTYEQNNFWNLILKIKRGALTQIHNMIRPQNSKNQNLRNPRLIEANSSTGTHKQRKRNK